MMIIDTTKVTLCNMITIVELPSYIKKAQSCFDEDSQKAVIDYLAVYPDSGVIIKGAGGIRKLRWSIDGKGKSGGVRVIYYYYNNSKPLYLLALFKKNEKSNLTKEERNTLAAMVAMLKK